MLLKANYHNIWVGFLNDLHWGFDNSYWLGYLRGAW